MRLLLIFLFPACLFAQASHIRFSITFNDSVLEPGKSYVFENRNISIENLKFYLSNLALLSKNKIFFEDSVKARLIDIGNNNSLIINLKGSPKFDKIVFNLGHVLDLAKRLYFHKTRGYLPGESLPET